MFQVADKPDFIIISNTISHSFPQHDLSHGNLMSACNLRLFFAKLFLTNKNINEIFLYDFNRMAVSISKP